LRSDRNLKELGFLRGQHRFGIGFGKIILGIRLILARLLSVSRQRIALLSCHGMVSVSLSHGDIVGAFGGGVVQVNRFVIDPGFRLAGIFCGILLRIRHLCSPFGLSSGDIVRNRVRRLGIVTPAKHCRGKQRNHRNE
jgi:hypothetical protein